MQWEGKEDGKSSEALHRRDESLTWREDLSLLWSSPGALQRLAQEPLGALSSQDRRRCSDRSPVPCWLILAGAAVPVTWAVPP